MDGWKTIRFLLGSAYFQHLLLLVSGRVSKALMLLGGACHFFISKFLEKTIFGDEFPLLKTPSCLGGMTSHRAKGSFPPLNPNAPSTEAVAKEAWKPMVGPYHPVTSRVIIITPTYIVGRHNPS